MQRQRFFQDPMLVRQQAQQPFGVPATSFPFANPHFFSRQLSDGMAQKGVPMLHEEVNSQ